MRPRTIVKPTAKAATANSSLKVSTHNASDLKVNMEIEHLQFGHGVIQDITVSELGEAIIVKFDNQPGVRKLLLNYAKFKIISE